MQKHPTKKKTIESSEPVEEVLTSVVVLDREVDPEQSGEFVALVREIGQNSKPLYKKRREELVTYEMDIDSDPIGIGLASLNKRLATVQQYKNRVNSMLIAVIREKHTWNSLYNKVEFYYEKKKRVLLRHSDVQGLRNRELQSAMVDSACENLLGFMAYCKECTDKVDIFLQQVDRVHKNLDSANQNLSRQITVAQMISGIH